MLDLLGVMQCVDKRNRSHVTYYTRWYNHCFIILYIFIYSICVCVCMYIYTYICIYMHVYIYISVISIILISRVLYFKMERHHKKISIEKSVIKLSFATSLRASETSLSWLFYIKSPRRRPTEKIRRFFIIIIIIISFFFFEQLKQNFLPRGRNWINPSR